jgi:hypothetical protein
MTKSRILVLASRLVLIAATAVAADASLRPAAATDAAAAAYFQALSKASEVTGTINTHGNPTTSLLPAPARHALTAWSHYKDARAAMERGLLLGEAAPKVNAAALEAAMAGLQQELKALAAINQPRVATAAKKAASLSQDWYEAGLKHIKPPAEGLVELPTQVVVASKGETAAAALDQLIQEASMPAALRSVAAPKRRARSAPPAPVAFDPFGSFQLHEQR